ncbi:MAG: alpha/beta hydrolase [Victivallaceae bacterium]|nr:alpha/beta hydrolase [Victivallaceae bacterium]
MKVFGIVAVLLLSQLALQAGKSSENTQWLKNVLKSHPKYDVNHDNILTAAEAMAYLKDKKKIVIAPTYKDVRYGKYSSNRLDIYLAASKQPTPVLVYFHGGAFAAGDKGKIQQSLLKECLKHKISVISVNYRLSSEKDYKFKYSKLTPFPPPFQDAARAIQFIRYNAKKYNINKQQLAVSGGSAGGGIALWLAFSPDLAKSGATDPLKRESTKPLAVVALYAQTTYDQEYITENMIYNGYKIAWINRLFKMSNSQLQDQSTKAMRKAVSPLELVDASDQIEAFMCLGNEVKVTADMEQSKFVHNLIFYRELEKKLKMYNIPYELALTSEYKRGHRKGVWYKDAVAFLIRAMNKRKKQ